MKKQYARHRWFVALLLTLGTLVSACGENEGSAPGSGTVDDSKVAEAAAAVQSASGPLQYVPVAKDLDVAPANGKDVWVIVPTLAIPLMSYLVDTSKPMLDDYGVDLHVVDGNGDVNQYNKGVQSAIAAGADVILLCVDAKLVAASVADAKDANIPVVAGFDGYPGMPVETDGVVADVGWDYRMPGTLLADWFVADSQGMGHALLLTSNDYVASVLIQKAFESEVDRLCPDTCEVTAQDSTVSQWQSRLQTLTQTSLQRDPAVNYVVTPFDAMTSFVLPGINQAGADDRVKVGSFNASPAVMQQLQDPGSPMAVDVGNSNEWAVGAVVDTLLRVMTGNTETVDYKIPFRIFDRRNTAGMDLRTENESWFGDQYLPYFRKVWINQ